MSLNKRLLLNCNFYVLKENTLSFFKERVFF